MNDILNKSTVLVLNRHWQAIHVKTPAEAFCMIASDIDLEQLESVFATHELGLVPPPFAEFLQRHSRTHQLGLVSNIWARKAPWLGEFERAGLSDVSRVTIFSSDSRSIKPSPVLFRQALRAFPAHSRTLFIGDSLQRDIAPAMPKLNPVIALR